MPSSPALIWCLDCTVVATTGFELVVVCGAAPLTLTVVSCVGCSDMPLPVVSKEVAVPGWTLLAAAVVEPELTRPWGLCVLVCPPLPELIAKPIGLYCKAIRAKVYTGSSVWLFSLVN